MHTYVLTGNVCGTTLPLCILLCALSRSFAVFRSIAFRFAVSAAVAALLPNCLLLSATLAYKHTHTHVRLHMAVHTFRFRFAYVLHIRFA